MNEDQRRQLDRDGFVLCKNVLSADEIEHLRAHLEYLWVREGNQAGAENYIEKDARRLANLMNKGGLFRPILCHAEVLEAARQVLGPKVRLNMMNARDALPHSGPSQPLHSDSDHGAMPDGKGYLCFTAIWLLDDFTRANGATRIIPGTHRRGQLPKEALADVLAPHLDEVFVEGKAGDVFVFNGHAWHAGGANRTDRTRRAVLVHYVRGDQPQRLNQRESLSLEVQAGKNSLEREVLGLDG